MSSQTEVESTLNTLDTLNTPDTKSLNIDMFPNRDLYDLVTQIMLETQNTKTFGSLMDRLKNDENYTYLNVKELDANNPSGSRYSLLYTPTISVNIDITDICINRVIHQMKSCVIDNGTLLPIVYIDKHINYVDEIGGYCNKVDSIIKDEEFLDQKDTIKIYKNHIGEYVVMFYHCDKWLLLCDNTLYDFYDENKLIPTLFRNIFEERCELGSLNPNDSFHFLLMHHKLESCIGVNENGKELRDILHFKTEEKYTLNRKDYKLSDKIKTLSRVYLSCKDEMMIYLDGMNSEMTSDGKLFHRGLMLCYESEQIKFTLNFDIELYKKINSRLKPYKNTNQAYVVMYQNDECNSMLSYITTNHTNIIKRINSSVKTISKEILDIYFLTRNRRNEKLYNTLPKSYRDILFNIHKIFINKRYNDIRENAIDNLDLKRSVTVNNVYWYLKKGMTGEELIELYFDREYLSKTIDSNSNLFEYKNTLCRDCIDTIMQTRLMHC